MISHGRALAVAAAWIVVPLVTAATVLSISASRSGSPLDGIVIALAVTGALVLSLAGLLAGAVWIARRSGKARSAAGLGTQAGLIGLLVAGIGVAWFVVTHQ